MIGTHEDPHTHVASSNEGARHSRWAALAVILSVALAGAVLGQMSVVRDDAARPVPPGPFSLLAH
ncbi:MAG: hypothetical protein V4514_11910 [Pseudomonadota bacterium]|uniref:hypothetical protein n=1 Tax=unclassified Phenylobacterium TaxID=2640670 RepID=UPI0006F66209|nr:MULTISPECIES: hypothetical protein [unclassified Phenylobacterium]KRB52325.1 hypothetical protein ASE02_12490 [Phenylobacterium sp. Root700]MBT9473968.1 hypothetical protein [Phenylobacterium sp.]